MNAKSVWMSRLAIGLGITVAIGAGVTYSKWWPAVAAHIDVIVHAQKGLDVDDHDHDHAHADEHGHAHASASQAEKQSLELSAQALKNLGLTSETLRPIELGNYQRTISVPAIVAARPGRTQIRVSSPLSGVVMHVHAVTGQAVNAR